MPGASSGGLPAGNLVGNLIVTAGNTVIGVAGKHNGLAQIVNGVVPKSGILTGKVTAILAGTGQTLVHIGEGTGGSGSGGLILDGVGGKLGALVALDLGKGKVIAAPEGSRGLIGLNVLAQNPNTGKLTTVSALSGGSLLAIDVKGASTNGGVLGGVVGTAKGATGGLLGKPVDQPQAPAQGQAKPRGLLGGVLRGKKD